jgi:uncharacterized membrane protein
MQSRKSLRIHFITALGFSTLVSVGFFVYGAWHSHSTQYAYLLWNLFLAWLPIVFAYRLVLVLRNKLWSSWEAMLFSVLWLLFLPNSFYMISDFIHLQDVQQDVLYDALMLTSFIYIGVLLGFGSLYMIHLELLKRFTKNTINFLIAITLLICSFAIYLGRDLRWNSWDVLTNPGGLLFDISARVLHPSAYPEMFLVVITFFVLLASMYSLVWRSIQLLRHTEQPDYI